MGDTWDFEGLVLYASLDLSFKYYQVISQTHLL